MGSRRFKPMLDGILEQFSAWENRKIVVAMSGGVDSAVSAALLHLAGAEVIGIHMRTWHYQDIECGLEQKNLATCCSPADAKDARKVADQFGFSFYAMDFQVNFRKSVIEPFIQDYLNGKTPNPCVNCNNSLKLGSLLAKGRAYGATAVATGHYGVLFSNPVTGRSELTVPADRDKDQTYYLFGLSQDQLQQMEMPLGGLKKDQVRKIAGELGLHLSGKPDSYEICFVSDNNYRRFIRDETDIDVSDLAGDIISTRGELLGRHEGVHHFTVGQRKGLGISAPKPLYVVELDPETRHVVVGYDEDTLGSDMDIERLNWVSIPEQAEPFRARVKIRYRSPGYAATIHPMTDRSGRANVQFDEPVRAITPGQAAVAYDEPTNSRVLAGGWIIRPDA